MRHGFTMLEFAIVAPVFLLLIFAGMNYAWLMFAQMNIQQAVDDGGRYASTGQEMSGSGSRITSIITTVQNEISVPGVSVSNLSICSIPPGETTSSCYNPGNPSGTAGAAGGPEYTVILSLTTTLPLWTPMVGQFFPSSGYTFTSTATFMSEPFNPSTTD